jgi:hypothetical protein
MLHQHTRAHTCTHLSSEFPFPFPKQSRSTIIFTFAAPIPPDLLLLLPLLKLLTDRR